MTDTGEIYHYLEAMPADCANGTTTTFPWAHVDDPIIAFNDALGSGRLNTKNIIEVLGPGTIYAAQVCVALTAGGYSDWFLPSYNELCLMYDNLHAKGLGGFQNDYYCSSSLLDGSTIRLLKFNDGSIAHDWFGRSSRVRAIRAF